MDWKERYDILFEDTLLSNFCQLGSILSRRYATINPCGVSWCRFCAQNRIENRMCKRAFRESPDNILRPIGMCLSCHIPSFPACFQNQQSRKGFEAHICLISGLPHTSSSEQGSATTGRMHVPPPQSPARHTSTKETTSKKQVGNQELLCEAHSPSGRAF